MSFAIHRSRDYIFLSSLTFTLQNKNTPEVNSFTLVRTVTARTCLWLDMIKPFRGNYSTPAHPLLPYVWSLSCFIYTQRFFGKVLLCFRICLNLNNFFTDLLFLLIKYVDLLLKLLYVMFRISDEQVYKEVFITEHSRQVKKRK